MLTGCGYTRRKYGVNGDKKILYPNILAINSSKGEMERLEEVVARHL